MRFEGSRLSRDWFTGEWVYEPVGRGHGFNGCREYQPTQPDVDTSWFSGKFLAAPFPVTTSREMTWYSVNVGSVQSASNWEQPSAGSPSPAMLRLMNSLTMKPSWFIMDGTLYVWVNTGNWQYVDPWKKHIDALGGTRVYDHMNGLSPQMELRLLQAYEQYYGQLQSDSPQSAWRGAKQWSDQCYAGFPSTSDPRPQHTCDWSLVDRGTAPVRPNSQPIITTDYHLQVSETR